jgi:PAS domain-containing protein
MDKYSVTREEAIGRTTVELGIYDEEAYRNIMEEAKAKGSVRNVEVSIKNRTGENRVLLVSREAIGIKGEPYLLAMGLDITDRKRAEEALEKRIVALTRPLEETEGIAFEDLFTSKKSRLQDQFAMPVVWPPSLRIPTAPITKPSNFADSVRT